MTDNVMHVGIEEPVQRRKDVLNIAVDTIQALKEFEIHKKINKEKAVYRKQFIHVVRELSKSIQEFRDALPAVHVHYPKEEKDVVKEKKAEVEVIKKLARKKETHLDKLEGDITSLRDKIAGL